MNDNANQGRKVGPFGAFLIGLFSGGGIAACITGWFVKKKCDSEKEEAIIEAQDRAVEATAKKFNENLQALVEDDSKKVYLNGGISTVSTLPHKSETTSAAYSQEPGEDILEWEVPIDDKDATEEALERTMQHDRYLNMVENYKNDPLLRPRRISEEQFTNDMYLEKQYISWYEDGVFANDQEGDRQMDDPLTDFGVTSGLELFPSQELDSDVVHICNERQGINYEITRVHKNYADLQNGSAYFNGPTA